MDKKSQRKFVGEAWAVKLKDNKYLDKFVRPNVRIKRFLFDTKAQAKFYADEELDGAVVVHINFYLICK